MKHRRPVVIWILPLLVFLIGITPGSVLAADAPAAPAGAAAGYEVWVIDQSDSSKDGGGTLYIYDGAGLTADPKSAKAETVDLGDKIAEACKEVGGYPKRPHMIFFTKDGKYGILSYVASGHVVFLDAAARTPIGCVSLGKNAHATFPAVNMKLAIGANIAEKKLVRIETDYANKKFTVNPSTDVVALATLETGGGLPDMAPICPIVENKNQYALVTPRGGGLAIFDITTTPMTNTGLLPKDSVHSAGCGGVQIGSTMYLNSGGGWPAQAPAPGIPRPARGPRRRGSNRARAGGPHAGRAQRGRGRCRQPAWTANGLGTARIGGARLRRVPGQR